jgi:diguanylate cyclase (GGDEF)-like protein/PAS domain S-box-containing protein
MKQYCAVVLVLAASLGTTYGLWQHERRNALLDSRMQVDLHVRAFLGRIEQRVAAYTQVLVGVGGLYAASPGPVSRDALRHYVNSQKLGADFPGLEGIGWAPLETRSKTNVDHANTARARAYAAPLEQFVAVRSGQGPTLGTDLSEDPARAEALLQARDSGGPVITRRLPQLLNLGSEKRGGFVLAMPVFRTGAAVGSVDDRRRNLEGWVLAAIAVDDWMASLDDLPATGLEVRVFDGIELSAATLMYGARHQSDDVTILPGDVVEYVPVAGRTWTFAMRMAQPVGELASRDHSSLIARSGIILSLLLAWLTWLLVTDRSRAMTLAREMTADLREAKERFELVFATSPDGIIISRQTDDRIIDVNPGFVTMTGYTRDEVVGQSLASLPMWRNPDDRQHFLNVLHTSGHCDNLETTITRQNGQSMVGIMSAKTANFKGHACVVGVVRDITARKLVEDRMAHMAQHDVLTGLPNRALFEDRLRQSINQAFRSRSRLALLYIDLDKFKPVNDTFGHAMGDVLLKMIAARMLASVRVSDTVARIGGDEFVVLLGAVQDKQDARAVAEKIRVALNQVFELEGRHAVHISSSIGAAVYPENGVDGALLARHADQAMYQAKQAGRNKVVFFGEPLDDGTGAEETQEAGQRPPG